MGQLPVIDIAPVVSGDDRDAIGAVAHRIDGACRDNGFFLIEGHGIDPGLAARLDDAARTFFARPDAEKECVAMALGGTAWRGWFPLGGELTSGVPDHKEGLYFGEELPPLDPRVEAGLPLHGPNLFPSDLPALRLAVLEWIEVMTRLGHELMGAISVALGLEPRWFWDHLTGDPTVLFRIFHYPPTDEDGATGWGVAEHTDYGLLTILAQDASGGLEVHGRDGWIEVPPTPGAFVVNIGDMLDRITGGRYRSTPHRVRSTAADRLSFPFFFDPGWDAVVEPIPLPDSPPPDDASTRWDRSSVHAFDGAYGDYLLSKVTKVFPTLAGD